jgi:hypothetical protein
MTRVITGSDGRKYLTDEPLLHPPKREWVGLTDREREECQEWLGHHVSSQVFYVIEAKLKEKNA